MKTIINETYFANIDEDAINFYNTHGWVVIENGIVGDLLNDSLNRGSSTDAMRKRNGH